MKLIDKDALVAEIERRKLYHIDLTEYNSGYKNAIFDVLSIIDSLEVKEVDLDEEINEHWDEWAKEDGFHFIDFAKHFFELGMAVSNKTQKGEEYDRQRKTKRD